tara:strand:- start:4373 stop:4792 length:420 start_codon:yes stop_codon:yes gene_type:complete
MHTKKRREKLVGLLFGTFDGIHEGHRFLIAQALLKVDTLYVSVADDSVIKKIKERAPRKNQKERMTDIRRTFKSVNVVTGDKILGQWNALEEQRPDVVFVGYDQKALQEALGSVQEKYGFKVIEIPSHMPEIFKSSLLN